MSLHSTERDEALAADLLTQNRDYQRFGSTGKFDTFGPKRLVRVKKEYVLSVFYPALNFCNLIYFELDFQFSNGMTIAGWHAHQADEPVTIIRTDD